MSRYPFFGNPAVYVDPAIVTFVASPALAERGSTVNAVSLNWSTSKSPDLQKLDGTVLPNSVRQTLIQGTFTDDASWKLMCADKQRSVQAKTTLSFCNNVFSGFVTTAPTDSAGISALDKTLQISRKQTLTVAGHAGKTFCYAFPKRLGTAKVSTAIPSDIWQPTTTYAKFVNYSTTTVSVTNGSGFTEDYTVLTFLAYLPGSTIVHIA